MSDVFQDSVNKVTTYVRQRTRQQYQQLIVDGLVQLHTWIEENGLRAAIAGLVTGMAIVVFFKLVVLFLCIAAVLAAAVWMIALPGENNGGGAS